MNCQFRNRIVIALSFWIVCAMTVGVHAQIIVDGQAFGQTINGCADRAAYTTTRQNTRRTYRDVYAPRPSARLVTKSGTKTLAPGTRIIQKPRNETPVMNAAAISLGPWYTRVYTAPPVHSQYRTTWGSRDGWSGSYHYRPYSQSRYRSRRGYSSRCDDFYDRNWGSTVRYESGRGWSFHFRF